AAARLHARTKFVGPSLRWRSFDHFILRVFIASQRLCLTNAAIAKIKTIRPAPFRIEKIKKRPACSSFRTRKAVLNFIAKSFKSSQDFVSDHKCRLVAAFAPPIVDFDFDGKSHLRIRSKPCIKLKRMSFQWHQEIRSRAQE